MPMIEEPFETEQELQEAQAQIQAYWAKVKPAPQSMTSRVEQPSRPAPKCRVNPDHAAPAGEDRGSGIA